MGTQTLSLRVGNLATVRKVGGNGALTHEICPHPYSWFADVGGMNRAYRDASGTRLNLEFPMRAMPETASLLPRSPGRAFSFLASSVSCATSLLDEDDCGVCCALFLLLGLHSQPMTKHHGAVLRVKLPPKCRSCTGSIARLLRPAYLDCILLAVINASFLFLTWH